MGTKQWRALVALFAAVLCLTSTGTNRSQVLAQSSLPTLSLQPGDFYFSLDGIPRFIFARNVTGYQQSDFDIILDWAKAGGTILARVQLDSLGDGMSSDGTLDESWARRWEAVFDKANEDGIYVLPVFSGWFDWNNGTPNYGYSTWDKNPLNAVNGGPAKTPTELFTKDSPTQKLWLKWMSDLVTRWQARPNIAAWEIFSEINIASGTSEAIGVDFLERASALIRSADHIHRPITLSLADIGEWSRFYRDKALDFIEIHPYPFSGRLDTFLIASVGQKLTRYNKPVLIGESGLSASTPDTRPATLTIAAHADIGINHAIWAAVVSGAMDGRMLYWEDSFGVYFNSLSFAWMRTYAQAELAAATVVKDVSFAGFKPLVVQLGQAPLVVGGAIGNQAVVIGWFRDAGCEPPDWHLRPTISKQIVSLVVPGTAANWQVDFYDRSSGTRTSSISVSRKSGTLTIPLPDFHDSIVFKATGKPSP